MAIVIVLLLSAPAHAGEWFTWDETNTKLHVPLTLTFLADYRQTLEIVDGCAPDESGNYTHHENNIFLGNCPSRSEVGDYFLISYLLTTGATYILPEKWSHGFQTGVLTMELIAVTGNYQLGISVKF